MLILAALVTFGLGQGPMLGGEDPGRRAESHCMAPAASSSATGLCILVKGLKIKLKHYYLRMQWRKKLDWPKICCKTNSLALFVGVQEQTVR